MKERPILFSAPMVRALLDGSKTQTRRVVKWPRLSESDGSKRRIFGEDDTAEINRLLSSHQSHPCQRGFCPYGQPGDRLWVRESWRTSAVDDDIKPRDMIRSALIHYEVEEKTDQRINWGKLRPSMFMPRWARRITLEVTGVRVERLQDISEADAIAEGVRQMSDGSGCWVSREGPGNLVTPWPTAREAYRDLWEQINGPGSWAANPWVWVIEFKKLNP